MSDEHGLSQQGVFLDTQTLKKHPSGHPTGFDISTSRLALAGEFLKKGLSGKYILVFTCPNGQADFLSTTHFHVEKWHKYPEIC